MKMVDKVEALRRTFPLISVAYGRYLHANESDLNRKGKRISVYMVIWSDDGRVSLHRTTFVKQKPMSAAEWGGWVQVNTPTILSGNVLAYLNRTFGSTWNIDRVFGWTFERGRSAK